MRVDKLELSFYDKNKETKSKGVCAMRERTDETRLIEMIHSSTDPQKAFEVAIKAILDFLASSQSPEAWNSAAQEEPAETIR